MEEAPAAPLHAFRLATKREKMKRRKAEAAAYRPGAGQLKAPHRRQDADKPKLKPKANAQVRAIISHIEVNRRQKIDHNALC